MWLNLSDTLYFFGEGGVIKVDPIDFRGQSVSEWKTILIGINGKLGICKESVEFIEQKLHEKA